MDAWSARYLACQEFEDLVALHGAYLEQFGIGAYLYATNPIAAEHGKAGHANDSIVASTYPKEFLDAYVGSGLYRVCPMMKWATTHTGVQSWDTIEPPCDLTALSREERALWKLFAESSVSAGFTLSFPLAHRNASAGMALMARSDVTQGDLDAMWDEQGCDIFRQCQLFHLCITALPAPAMAQILTDRQREALELVIAGRTMRDIAQAMDVSVTTVEKHLRAARDALHSDTTAQAVAKALVLHQIFLPTSKDQITAGAQPSQPSDGALTKLTVA